MNKTFAEQLVVYQSNVLPDLLQTLADQLHVSPEALQALEIGYALRVPLKGGKEIQNYWVFPERSDEGEVIGLSLRGWDGKKLMVPGSKRGLIYVPNIHPSTASPERYIAGPQNWTHTSEDIPCPVCGRTHYCMVSSENPDDPRSVICTKAREGAHRDLGESGYLHILKPEGFLKTSGPVLRPSDDPVLIVEGATDVAAAFDLGLVAIGRPSSTGGLGQLAKLVTDRLVVVVGERDAGAGIEGMERTFENVKGSAKKAIKLLPPEGIKDLREWVRRGVTKAQLVNQAKTAGVSTSDERILDSIAPMDLAVHWLDKFHQSESTRTLIYLHQTWYSFTGKCYEALSRETIRGNLYAYFGGKRYKKLRTNGYDIFNFEPNKRKIDEIIDALKAICSSAITRVPFWLETHVDTPDPVLMLSFPNGQISVEEYLQDGPVLRPTTPLLFTLGCYPYDFDPGATCPRWFRFLKEVFPYDRLKAALLQEWFGYNLIPDNSYEKFVMMLGPTRAGKSTILDALTNVLGERQVIATSLRNLTQRFGLYPFFGKFAAVIGDVSTGRNYDATEALNVLKRITGNDRISIERKGKDIEHANIRLQTRFTMASNSMPQFPDYARTIESRILVLRFTRSFAGCEDTDLKATIQTEAPGILLWALEGLRRLREQEVFTLPKQHAEELIQIRSGLTPLQDFVDECCETGDGADFTVDARVLYACWRDWAGEHGEKIYGLGWLYKKLGELFQCQKDRPMIDGERRRILRRIKLNDTYLARFGGDSR